MNLQSFNTNIPNPELLSNAELVMVTEYHSSPAKTLAILNELNLGSGDLILLEGVPTRYINRDLFDAYDLPMYEAFMQQKVTIGGWDSELLCEKVLQLSQNISMGNDEEFDALMRIAVLGRNKVMFRSIDFYRKQGFKRIVVVMGNAHYDESARQYCENSGLTYAWV